MALLARDRRGQAIVAAAICFAAIAASVFATSTGVGVSPDSTEYLGIARLWLTPFPSVPQHGSTAAPGNGGPLYPAALALTSLALRQDPSVAARWLNVFILPLNLVLIGALVRRAAPSARYAPAIAAVLFFAAPDLLTVHAMAWSEPIFITLILAGILTLDTHLARPRASTFLALVAIAAAACLQRFASAAFVFTAAAAICVWEPSPLPRRVVSASIFAGAAVVPVVMWGRSHPGFQGLAFHPITPEWLVPSWPILARWLVPVDLPVGDAVRGWPAAVGLLALGWIAARPAGSRIAAILAIFIASSAGVILLAASFWDANLVPDGRIFVPMLVAAIALVTIGLSRPFNDRRLQRAALAAVSVWAIAMAAGSATWLGRAHAEGLGYNSRAWQDLQIIRAIRELPERTFLVSAANDAVTAVTGRPASRLPDKVNPGTLAPNPEYASELARLADRLRARDGVIVFFDRLRDRPYIPGESDLAREWSLVLVTRTSDGAIYRLKRSGE